MSAGRIKKKWNHLRSIRRPHNSQPSAQATLEVQAEEYLAKLVEERSQGKPLARKDQTIWGRLKGLFRV